MDRRAFCIGIESYIIERWLIVWTIACRLGDWLSGWAAPDQEDAGEVGFQGSLTHQTLRRGRQILIFNAANQVTMLELKKTSG